MASPIYVIRMDTNNRIGPTEVTIRIRRVSSTDDEEEHLAIESAVGTVAGARAAFLERPPREVNRATGDKTPIDP